MIQNSVTPNGHSDQLFSLVKTLTKAEKRNFKLYANRGSGSGDQKYIRLFDVLDKATAYDEEIVRKKVGRLTKGKLANLKRHLYKQILISLRLIHISKNSDIEIREQIDFARILYGRGLYLQALKLLDRMRTQALENNHDLLYLEILEFQKLIEERHITRSRQIKGKVEALMLEASKYSNITQNRCSLSNLKIQMHGYYIQHGHIQKEEDIRSLEYFLKASIQHINIKNLSFFEKVYLNQSYFWYNYTLLDFKKCFKHAKDWVKIFDNHPHMIELDMDLYMRGIYYAVTSAFDLKDKENFKVYLEKFERFHKSYSDSFNEISKVLCFVYLNIARINKHYLHKTFKQGIKLIPGLLHEMKSLDHSLDLHRIMVFNYKIGYLYFGAGKSEQSLDYLNEIVNLKSGHLRNDIQIYARSLSLMAHYEMGNYELIPYLADQTIGMIKKIQGAKQTELALVKFLKNVSSLAASDRPLAFQRFKKELVKLAKIKFEKRSFVHLNIMDWVEQRCK